MDDISLLRYSRHILLDDIGLDIQEKWLSSRVLVVGCGGLGSALLPILAASGVGHLIFCDDDVVEWSNLQRQTLFTEADVGQKKALVTEAYLSQRNKDIKLSAYTTRVTEHVLMSLLEDVDVLVDCTDNFKTRQLINRVAVAHRIPLVSAAVIAFSAQLMVFDYKRRPSDTQMGPCYACFCDEEERQESCALMGVFSPLVHVAGAMQSLEVLKLLGGLGETQDAKMLSYDALYSRWETFILSSNPDCPVCASKFTR